MTALIQHTDSEKAIRTAMKRLSLILLFIFLWATPGLAAFSTSFLNGTMPIGACNGFAITGDGCSGAPAASSYTYEDPGFFPTITGGTQTPGDAQQSGQVYGTTGGCTTGNNSAVCHPPWAVAGVDYPVGVSVTTGFGTPGGNADPTNFAATGWGLTQAVGWVSFVSPHPQAGDTITLDGTVWTFVSSLTTGNQLLVGGSPAATLAAAIITLNASTDVNTALASYQANATQIQATYKTGGSAGVSFTLASNGGVPGTPTLTPAGCSIPTSSSPTIFCGPPIPYTGLLNIGPFDFGPTGNSFGKAIALGISTSGQCNIHDNNFVVDLGLTVFQNGVTYTWTGCSSRNITNNIVTVMNSVTGTHGVWDENPTFISALFSFNTLVATSLQAPTTLEYNAITSCPARCFGHGNLVEKFNYIGGVMMYSPHPTDFHGDGRIMGFADNLGSESCSCSGVQQVTDQFSTWFSPSGSQGETTCWMCGNITFATSTENGVLTTGNANWLVTNIIESVGGVIGPQIGQTPNIGIEGFAYGGEGTAILPLAEPTIIACPNGVPPTPGACTGELGTYVLSGPWISHQSTPPIGATETFDNVPVGGIETFNTVAIGGITGLGTITPGSGAQSGTYVINGGGSAGNIAFTVVSGACTGATAASVLVGNGTGGLGGVTAIVVQNPGSSCTVGTVLTISSTLLGGLTGFSVPIASVNTSTNPLVPGTGGTAGTYTTVPLTGGSCTTAPVANITVASGGVTAVSLTGTGDSYGLGCAVGDVLSAASANIGGVSGFSITVGSIGTLNQGSGATSTNTYNNVPLTGTSGCSGVVGDITVTNGVGVTKVTLAVNGQGAGCVVGSVLTIPSADIGGVTGASTTVTSLDIVTFSLVPTATINNMLIDHMVMVGNPTGPTSVNPSGVGQTPVSFLVEAGATNFTVTNVYYDGCGSGTVVYSGACVPGATQSFEEGSGVQQTTGNNVRMNDGVCFSDITQSQIPCGTITTYSVPVSSFSPGAADTNVLSMGLGIKAATGLTPSITQGAKSTTVGGATTLTTAPTVGDAILAAFKVNTGSSTPPATPTCSDNATGGSNTYTIEQINLIGSVSDIYSYVAVAPVTRTISSFAVTCTVTGAASQVTVVEEATNVATGAGHTTNPTDNPGGGNAGNNFFGSPAAGANTVETAMWTQQFNTDLIWAAYFGSATSVSPGTIFLPFVAGPSATQGSGTFTENIVQ